MNETHYFYKLVVAYDGTNYHGWQLQDEYASIVGALQKAYHEVFKQDVGIVGASRTDAGVHALHQVVRARSTVNLEPAVLKRVWNGRLPRDIHIRSVERVTEEFHPQRAVRQKTYWYHFSPERVLPLYSRYITHYRFAIDEQKFKDVLQLFIGEHDFRSFCTGDEQETTVRTVDAITVTYLKQYRCYRASFHARGFLRYMIRRIVGAALHAASHEDISVDDVRAVLRECNPLHKLPTAPAQGLVLRKILYNFCSDKL